MNEFFSSNTMIAMAWLWGFVAVAAGANQIIKFWKNLKGPDQQPPNAQLDQKNAQLREKLEASHGEVERRLDGHDTEISGLWNTMRNEDKDIRNQIFEEVKQMRAEFSEKIEELPEKIIRLLKNTSAKFGE